VVTAVRTQQAALAFDGQALYLITPEGQMRLESVAALPEPPPRLRTLVWCDPLPVRAMTLPVRDARLQVLATGAVEDLWPGEMRGWFVASLPAGHGKPVPVLAAALPEALLQERLSILREAGWEPQRLVLPEHGLAQLLGKQAQGWYHWVAGNRWVHIEGGEVVDALHLDGIDLPEGWIPALEVTVLNEEDWPWERVLTAAMQARSKNLLLGPYAPSSLGRTLWRQGRVAAAMLAGVMVLALVLSWVGASQQLDRAAAIQAGLGAQYQELFPGARVVVPLDQMKQKVDALRRSVGRAEAGVVPLLAKMQSAIAGFDLQVEEIEVTDGAINLRGQVASFDAAEQLRAKLAALGEATIADARSQEDKVRVTLRVLRAEGGA